MILRIIETVLTVISGIVLAGVIAWIVRECCRDTVKLLRELRTESKRKGRSSTAIPKRQRDSHFIYDYLYYNR